MRKISYLFVLVLAFSLLLSTNAFACSACNPSGENPLAEYSEWRQEEPYSSYYVEFRETPPDISEIELTDEEIERIREGGFEVGVAMHYLADPFSEQIAKGLTNVLDELNIKLLAITDAEFDSTKQVNDLETIRAMNPDAIFSLPTDELAMGEAYKEVADDGIPLVLTCNIFKGARHRENFESVVVCNSWINGRLAAELIADYLDGSGKIGTIEHGVEFYCTGEREINFSRTIRDNYPDIEIVATDEFTAPEQATSIAETMLTANPDIEALFVTWDDVAMNAAAGLSAIGRDDVAIITTDIGDEIARQIAIDGIVKATAAHSAIEQGEMAGLVVANLLLGKETPIFFRPSSIKITRDNLEEGYEELQKEPLPDEIRRLL